MNDTKPYETKYYIFFLVIFFLTFTALADDPDAGAIAPDFEITQLDGTQFKLSDYKGKQSVYLVFWNTWCHYCIKKIPKLKAAQLNLPNKIKIIAVNTTNKDSLGESVEFQKKFKINYPLAFDHGEIVTDLYNVWGTPTEFIIDINGIIQHRDGVPGNLSDYLTKWNTKNTSFSQTLMNYYQLAMNFLTNLRNAS